MSYVRSFFTIGRRCDATFNRAWAQGAKGKAQTGNWTPPPLLRHGGPAKYANRKKAGWGGEPAGDHARPGRGRTRPRVRPARAARSASKLRCQRTIGCDITIIMRTSITPFRKNARFWET